MGLPDMAHMLPPEDLRRFGRSNPGPRPSWLIVFAVGYLLAAAALQGFEARNVPTDDEAMMRALTD
jgi:hypothetical protein